MDSLKIQSADFEADRTELDVLSWRQNVAARIVITKNKAGRYDDDVVLAMTLSASDARTVGEILLDMAATADAFAAATPDEPISAENGVESFGDSSATGVDGQTNPGDDGPLRGAPVSASDVVDAPSFEPDDSEKVN